MADPQAPGRTSPATDGPLGRSAFGRRVERTVRFLDVPETLRWTGLPQLVGFYRHFAFAGPRTTSAAAALLAVALAAVTAAHLAGGSGRPVYATVGLGAAAAAALAVGIGVLRGRRSAWRLGSLLGVAWVAVYLVVRSVGLPGLPGAIDRWDDPAGTVGMALAAGFVALNLGVLTGVLVAHPDRRTWRD